MAFSSPGSQRFGGRAEREIYVADDYATVAITDRLLEEGHWQGLLQIPGDLEVTIEGSSVIVVEPGTGRQMSLKFSCDTDLSLSSFRAEQQPLRGWGQNPNGYGPLTTLCWTVQGASTVQWAISFNHYGLDDIRNQQTHERRGTPPNCEGADMNIQTGLKLTTFVLKCKKCKSRNVVIKSVLLQSDYPDDPDTSVNAVCQDCGQSEEIFAD